MQGVCKTCGCVCVLDEVYYLYGCPACRAARVAEAFKPVDPLRTALGMHGSFRINRQGSIVPLNREELEEGSKGPIDRDSLKKELKEALAEKGILWHESEGFYRPASESDYPTIELSDDESGHRLAHTLDLDDDAQTYELRRMFRL